MDNRDFKGVWIPKEIWLNTELTVTDKVLLVEIDSLDNEEHCVAGNDYLAEFCQCSERKITESIKKLAELGYIEVVSFDGRHRTIKSLLRNRALISMQSREKCESPTNKVRAINIDNNITNKEYDLSKDKSYEKSESEYESHSYSKEDFLGSNPKKQKVKRKSLYDQCFDENMLYTQDTKLFMLLNQYLAIRLNMKDKKLYGVNQWKGLLNKLSDIVSNNPGMSYEEVVNQSIEKGYASFYPIKTSSYRRKDVFSEYGEVSCKKASEEDIIDEEY